MFNSIKFTLVLLCFFLITGRKRQKILGFEMLSKSGHVFQLNVTYKQRKGNFHPSPTPLLTAVVKNSYFMTRIT